MHPAPRPADSRGKGPPKPRGPRFYDAPPVLTIVRTRPEPKPIAAHVVRELRRMTRERGCPPEVTELADRARVSRSFAESVLDLPAREFPE
jgi:hypothetical protein